MLLLPTAAGALALAASAVAPPAACNNAPQISDVKGDGHHASSDVLGAWLSEASGHLQAVISVDDATWVAAHDDADVPGSGFAFVYTTPDGARRYVRANAPGPSRANDPVTYDFGTLDASGQFVSGGATSGTAEKGSGGTVTIDVPGVALGAKLTGLYVITYDGISNGVPAWVDHAPGGVAPDDPARGGDYVVGSCSAAPSPPGTTVTTTSVQLSAPAQVKGARTVTVSGKLAPARAGVAVTLARTANRKTVTTQLTSAANGTFSARLPISETTRLRASAENVASSEVTITAFTKVKIKLRHRGGGSILVTGTVDPKLPGKVQWLRSNAVTPSARTTTRKGSFRLRINHPRRGRYQAVVIPTGDRAERATSNTGVIR
jgi:hypothetical protein